MKMEIALLENLARQLGRAWERMCLAHSLEGIPAEAAGLSDRNDALAYPAGGKHPRPDTAQAKTALMEALPAPQANGERGDGFASNAL